MPRGREIEGKYPITLDYESEYEINTVEELKRWVRERGETYSKYLDQKDGFTPDFQQDYVGGLFVVQTSISYEPDKGVFTQEGTAPNHLGGVWSLATCRHMHRGHDEGGGGWNFDQFFTEDPNNEDILWPTQPTLIVCAAGSQELLGRSRRPVASIAFVTHGFWTVKAYSDFLRRNCNSRAIGCRLTHATESEYHSIALEFGDCHSDREGRIEEPPEGHDHHEGTESSCDCSTEILPHKDTASDHVKCLSLTDYWHGYSSQPELEISNIGDRGVKYINSFSDLDQHLIEYGIV